MSPLQSYTWSGTTGISEINHTNKYCSTDACTKQGQKRKTERANNSAGIYGSGIATK